MDKDYRTKIFPDNDHFIRMYEDMKKKMDCPKCGAIYHKRTSCPSCGCIFCDDCGHIFKEGEEIDGKIC